MSNPIDMYVDFDGVLNMFHVTPAMTDIKRAVEQGFKLTWHQKNVDWINALPENVNFIWHTTWNDHNLAKEVLTPLLGITRPVTALPYHTHGGMFPWWKDSVLQNHLTNTGNFHPYIWIDDDLKQEEPWNWPQIDQRLLVSPDMKIGLTNRHQKVVNDFVTRWS